MPISLQKGQKVSLTKGNPGLTKVVVGLGWDVNSFDTGGDFDLDAAAFLLGDSGKVASSGDFVFYGNLKHSSGAVEHLGDNLTGEGAGDDEQIRIDLTKVPANIQRIAFTVTIYEAESRRQNFGMVRCSAMTWERTSPSRRRPCSASCTRTTASGSSTPSAAAIRAAWRPCAPTTAWTWSKRAPSGTTDRSGRARGAAGYFEGGIFLCL